jgi:hypothetical protein
MALPTWDWSHSRPPAPAVVLPGGKPPDPQRRLAKLRRGLASLAIVTAVFALVGCKKSEPAPSSESPAASATPEAPKGAAPASEFHEETFDLALRPVGPAAAGKPASAEVVLIPKAGYHTNDKYPYKFKTSANAGVSYRTPVFTKDDVTLEEQRATMKLDFTPDSVGEKTLSGQFAFSLCSAEKCLVEKRDLTLNVAVN